MVLPEELVCFSAGMELLQADSCVPEDKKKFVIKPLVPSRFKRIFGTRKQVGITANFFTLT